MDISQVNKSEETVSALVVAGCNTAKLLQLQEERFHQVALLVKAPIHVPRIGFIAFGRNAQISAMVGDLLPQFPFVGFVCQDGHSGAQFDRFRHVLRRLHVMHISG